MHWILIFGQAMAGFVVSRTTIVCRPLVLLPQASVAVQVRQSVLVLPQLLLTMSLKVMVTVLQASGAVAAPVTFVRVSPGHSSTRFAGNRSAGGVVSRTVIVCSALVALPQASATVQVRKIILLPPQKLVTRSE